MADYIYTMEIRLTPDQQRGVTLVQEISRAAEMNIYLTGGAVRDIISGFPIRDLDFTVQGNPLKLQKELERAGAVVSWADEDLKAIYLVLPGSPCRDQSGPHRALRQSREAAHRCAFDHYRRLAPPRFHSERDGTIAEPRFAGSVNGSVQRGGGH